MGKAARLERRHRQQRAGVPVADPLHGVMVGWCRTPADLPAARKGLHDNLIAMMGSTRRGPVTWREIAWPEADEIVCFMMEDAGEKHRDHYRRIRGLLREYHGIVIIASAPGPG